MAYDDAFLREAHKGSSQHRESVVSSKCGCFDCLSIFAGRIVTEWIDKGQTALCPICKIDTVLPVSDKVPADNGEFLKAMQKFWMSAS